MLPQDTWFEDGRFKFEPESVKREVALFVGVVLQLTHLGDLAASCNVPVEGVLAGFSMYQSSYSKEQGLIADKDFFTRRIIQTLTCISATGVILLEW